MAETYNSLSRYFPVAISKMYHLMSNYEFAGKKMGFLVFIVELVGFKEEVNMTMIREHMQIAASTATRYVDQLVDMDMLERYTPKGNRRSVFLRLTPTGKKVYEELKTHQQKFNAEILHSLSNEQLLGLQLVMERIVNAQSTDLI